ncbi:hypothetical protein V2J09_009779 [Rumex salicifolius]
MVQTKHQKGKQKKQPQKKKHGKQADISELRDQLDALGLKIIQVTADGNCFFRGLADQLEGDQEEHKKYRSMAVNYIKKNREMFEPFIEDEVPFDEYCESMEKDGTWAGHMELQAASLVTHSNICIHQSLLPRWYIRNFDDKIARMIHLSYHDGEHYNSVRSKEDPCDGAARSIIIKVDVSLTAKSKQGKSAMPQSQGLGKEHLIHSGCIKMVMSGSGCEDAGKVEQVLKQVDGDTDAAIEYLIAERGSQDVFAEDIKVDCQTDAKNENSKPQKTLLDTPTTQDRGSEVRQKDCDSVKPSKNDKKIPRNKVCPCGSKKKYKSCCGAAAGRTSKFAVEEMDDLCKGKKGKKLGKKGASSSSDGSLVNGPWWDVLAGHMVFY